jgi:hypothetical protein
MRVDLAVAFLLLLGSAPAQEIPAQELWKLVAQSHAIIVGTPTVPVDQIEESQRSGEHRYIDIPVRVKDCIKGDPCPGTAVVRYFTRTAWYSPVPPTLIESSGVQSLLFLTLLDNGETYFAGHTPKAVQAYSRELVSQVSAEVLAQKQIIDQFPRNFRPKDEASYAKVRSLIEAMVHRRTEKRAFTGLEALGQVGVPAMIMLMDDRRELPIKEISLRNPSGTFEDIRHYGPHVVVDSVDAILNQITDEHFGTIQNGASERERKAAIAGWRVYLHRKRFGMHEPTGYTDGSSTQPCPEHVRN